MSAMMESMELGKEALLVLMMEATALVSIVVNVLSVRSRDKVPMIALGKAWQRECGGAVCFPEWKEYKKVLQRAQQKEGI
eukprot:12739357-Ditylum_brightwellii.AAC.1